MHRTTALAVVGALLSLAAPAFGWLDTSEPGLTLVNPVADGRFSFVNGPGGKLEWLNNYGRSSSSRMKGNQDVTALKFNLSAYKGLVVQEAELHLARQNTNPIHAVVAATINNDWPEGTRSGGEAGVGDSCWRWRSRPSSDAAATLANEWTYSHSDFATASFGNFGSLVCYSYYASDTLANYTSGGYTWMKIRLDPAVVQAMILDQYGLMVTDARGYLLTYNPTVYMREQTALRPRLYIKFATAPDLIPPSAVIGLTAQPGPENGEVVLRWLAPADPDAGKAFGYTVRYSAGGGFATATDVARWRIPRPKAAGEPQRMLIEDLVPGATYTFYVQAYDAANNGSDVQSVVLTLPVREAKSLADGEPLQPDPTGKTVREVPGVLRWWAAAETAKINPGTGNRIEDDYAGTGADAYKKANVVWDAGTNTIRLMACRNEVVGAQLILERLGGSLSNVQVTVSDLASPNGGLIPSNPYVELFQLHYVTNDKGYRYPDAAIPLGQQGFAGTFHIPDLNRNPYLTRTVDGVTEVLGGVNQSVWMDLYVPKEAVPGDYSGTVTITATQLAQPVTVDLHVQVNTLEMPDTPTFTIDMNGYSRPWYWSGANESLSRLRLFQAAHKHRAVPNIYPIGWNGSVQPARNPTTVGSGETMHAYSWAGHDAAFGPFFDGTAFLPTNPSSPYYGPGQGVPISRFYTGISEMWPVSMVHSTLGYDAPAGPTKGGAYYNSLLDGGVVADRTLAFTNMPDVWLAFPYGYQQANRNLVADWFAHAKAKGWTRTAFQIYLNNKWDYNGSYVLWTLEECDVADDFRAVGFFHQLWRDGQAAANAPEVKWHFRIDISDRWGQNYGQLDNRINLHMMGSAAASWYWPSIEYRSYLLDEDKSEEWNWYGGGNGPDGEGINQARLYFQRWSQGFTGGTSWWDHFQTDWSNAEPLSSVYKGQYVPGHGMYQGCLMSIRVKMMRQAEQVIELLNMLAQQAGWDRTYVRDALKAKYGDGTHDFSFESLTEEEFYQLRSDLIAMVEDLTYLPGDMDGDGEVSVLDIVAVVTRFGAAPGDDLYDPLFDIDRDGEISVLDIVAVVTRFGQTL